MNSADVTAQDFSKKAEGPTCGAFLKQQDTASPSSLEIAHKKTPLCKHRGVEFDESLSTQ